MENLLPADNAHLPYEIYATDARVMVLAQDCEPDDHTSVPNLIATVRSISLPSAIALAPDGGAIAAAIPQSTEVSCQAFLIASRNSGKGTSLAYLVNQNRDADALFVASPRHQQVLATTYESILNALTPHMVVIPTYKGKRGNLALFSRVWFEVLSLLSGDQSIDLILNNNPLLIGEIEVNDPFIF